MDYVKTLVDAGLDHVQITLESHLSDIHDEIVNSTGAWKQTTIQDPKCRQHTFICDDQYNAVGIQLPVPGWILSLSFRI